MSRNGSDCFLFLFLGIGLGIAIHMIWIGLPW